MSRTFDALSARNLIFASASLLVLSLLWVGLSALRPNDSGGMGRDSYGTQGYGYRAALELLDELGVRSERELAPPRADEPLERTVVLLGPDARLVRTGPKYLAALLEWVDRGGRLVVAPSSVQSFMDEFAPPDEDDEGPADVLEALELSDRLELHRAPPAMTGYGGAPSEYVDDDDEGYLPDFWSRSAPPPVTLSATWSGEWSALDRDVRQVAAPGEGFARLVHHDGELDATLTLEAVAGDDILAAALVRRGLGEIVVVAEPLLFSNGLLAQADNSVLAARLFAPAGAPVAFDEFYHGLAVRGNVFFLLTKPGFATAAAGLLLAICAWTWRSAAFLGPPLADAPATRRDINEYLDAMGAFFSRGRDSRRFLASELRDGVLRELCRRQKLPIETPEPGRIVAALARRDPQRAERLERALDDVDAALAGRGKFPSSQFLPAMQRLTTCL